MASPRGEGFVATLRNYLRGRARLPLREWQAAKLKA